MMDFPLSPGTVYFVGAGPGAPDLITVRGRTIIEQADLVLYADSLVQTSVAGLARKPQARIVGSSDLHLEQIVALMIEAAQAGQIVARVHTGDPALYGAIHEQMCLLQAQKIPYVVVPGVTAAFAAAAQLGVELTIPELSQSLILSRMAGRTPVPPREALRSLASHGTTLALYLSVAQIEEVTSELLAGGAYSPSTPVAVVYRATWPDEQITTGTLSDIAAAVRAAGYQRHALILVGPALRPAAEAAPSRLYAASFAHGCREAPADPQLHQVPEEQPQRPAILAVTRNGAALAVRLARELGAVACVPERFAAETQASQSYSGSVAEAIAAAWATDQPLILIMASGIALRALAPLLNHKHNDPAVICLDEAGRSVIPLLGGHQAGANALARRIAKLTGGHAAITTASDTQGLPALDLLGQPLGWRPDPTSALTHVMACLVNGQPLACYLDPAIGHLLPLLQQWLAPCSKLNFVATPTELCDDRYHAALLISPRSFPALWPALQAKSIRYYMPLLVAGIGCQRGASADELEQALNTTLADLELERHCLAALATAEIKADEPGLLALAQRLDLPLKLVSNAAISALDVGQFSPSAASTHIALPGVAEPSAVLAANGLLMAKKRAFGNCTVAVALLGTEAPKHRNTEAQTCSNTARERQPVEVPTSAPLTAAPCASPPPCSGRLTLVSLGPGDPQQMTLAAHSALRAATVVVGYKGYIDALGDLLTPQQQVIASGMQTELERARQALDHAMAGQQVVLVSSGDIGIYAMAGPVFELLAERGWDGKTPAVHVLAGVSAFQAAAAHLGAAISHDFCVISLSDLLTPWPLIEQRLSAAAAGDFVVALYNPRSRERHWQLDAAFNILRSQRPASTPIAFATNVARPEQQMTLTTLGEADPTKANMFTVVLIGNSRSYRMGDHVVTPRGYAAAKLRGGAQAQADQPKVHTEPTERAASYPIVLTNLNQHRAVVIGGGPVGERKVRGLLATGIAVRLISPTATTQLQQWASAGQITWEARPYQLGDLTGAWLVFAATNQREVNAQIAQAAAAEGMLCNSADAPNEGSFHLPAIHRGPAWLIAVSTDGNAPGRAAAMRDAIAQWLISNAIANS